MSDSEDLMYFDPAGFSPRYGDKFFTQKFIDLSNSEAIKNTITTEDDNTPPGNTNMLKWIAEMCGVIFIEDCCCIESSIGNESEHAIHVRRGKNDWTIYKKYSDFRLLIQQLTEVIPNHIVIDSYTLLPKQKSCIFVSSITGSSSSGSSSNNNSNSNTSIGSSNNKSKSNGTTTAAGDDSDDNDVDTEGDFDKDNDNNNNNDITSKYLHVRHKELSKFLNQLLNELSQKNLINTNNIIYNWLELSLEHGKGKGEGKHTSTKTALAP